MKDLCVFWLFSIFMIQGYAQLESTSNAEAELFANAVGGNPILNLAMVDIRAKTIKTTYTGKVLGSPYLNEKFTLSKLFYDKDELGDFYIRFNALNSEIEIKESLKNKEIKRLIADKKISVKYGAKELRFTTYITKKKETKNGYLSKILEGKNYKLYHRLAIKYVEGKAAANSMLNAVPSRYAPFVEFYYQEIGIDRIDQLAHGKSRFLNQIKKQHKDVTKDFIKENSIALDKEEDLMKVFEYLNTL